MGKLTFAHGARSQREKTMLTIRVKNSDWASWRDEEGFSTRVRLWERRLRSEHHHRDERERIEKRKHIASHATYRIAQRKAPYSWENVRNERKTQSAAEGGRKHNAIIDATIIIVIATLRLFSPQLARMCENATATGERTFVVATRRVDLRWLRRCFVQRIALKEEKNCTSPRRLHSHLEASCFFIQHFVQSPPSVLSHRHFFTNNFPAHAKLPLALASHRSSAFINITTPAGGRFPWILFIFSRFHFFVYDFFSVVSLVSLCGEIKLSIKLTGVALSSRDDGFRCTNDGWSRLVVTCASLIADDWMHFEFVSFFSCRYNLLEYTSFAIWPKPAESVYRLGEKSTLRKYTSYHRFLVNWNFLVISQTSI